MSDIKIVECGEPLVNIKKYCPKIVIELDKYRIKSEKNVYLRKTVAQMINCALTYLPDDMTFIIRDAWRPQSVQENIFQNFFKHFSKKYPTWSKARIIREISKYVAPARGKSASGHMTGGAVDLRLIKNGRKISMNNRHHLTYQENAQSIQTKLPKYLQKNRQLMFNALLRAGLSNYPKEYWHWSYGDIQWAKRNKKTKAIYSVITKTPQ
ncbi:MAG: M15 family metallopeptidase [Candidatus Buchananbacteria bacterium]|nr:M15 family metallopeptidase [Candidatus Buchananbacteria bacterium]